MRNYQEDIPPWKKEVLMRRDGLSKAVEKETCLPNLEDEINTQTHQANSSRQPRYRIGSNFSFMSKVKNFFVDDRSSLSRRNSEALNGSQKTGTLYSLFFSKTKIAV